MKRFVLLAVLLSGCAQYEWRADTARYPTMDEQKRAFAQHRYACLRDAQVFLPGTPSVSIESNTGGNIGSGYAAAEDRRMRAEAAQSRVETNHELFEACMAGAGFDLVQTSPGLSKEFLRRAR